MTHSMGIKVTNITEYTPSPTDVFLFDANIWVFLFMPLGRYGIDRQRVYSSFLKSVITSGSTIFINSLLLSEFANVFIRNDFKNWEYSQRPNKVYYKKDFVGSDLYKQTVKEVTVSITQILKFCEKGSDNFNSLDINNVLNNLKIIDFNDSYYIELSAFSKYKIVTDDQDFIKYNNHNQEVLTCIRE